MISRIWRLGLAPFFDQGIISLANFLTTVVLISATNLDTFGQIAYLTAIGLMGQALVTTAVVLPMSTLLPQQDQPGVFLSGSLVASFLVSLPVALIILMFWALLGNGVPEGLAFCLAFVASAVQDCARRQLYLTGVGAMSTVVVGLRYCLPVTAIYLWSGFEPSAVHYWLLVSLGSLLALFLQVLSTRRPRVTLDALRVILASYFHSGTVLLSWSVMQLAADNMVFLVSGLLLQPSQLGIWRSMQSIVSVVNPGLIALESVVPIRASRRYRDEGPEKADRWLMKVCLWTAASSGVVLLVIGLQSRALIELLFPSVSTQYAWIVWLYCIIQFCLVLQFFIAVRARIFGQLDVLVLSSVCSLFVAAVLAASLPVYLGLFGAVVGVVIVVFAGVLLAWCFSGRATIKHSPGSAL